jgi:hypothetical protein
MRLTSPLLRRFAASLMSLGALVSPMSAVVHAAAMAHGVRCGTMQMPSDHASGSSHQHVPPCCNAAFASNDVAGLPGVPPAPVIRAAIELLPSTFFRPLDRVIDAPRLLPFAQGPPPPSA